MWRLVKRWLNTGTSEALGFKSNTRIRTVNLAAMIGSVVSLIFTIINFRSGNYLLAAHTAGNLLVLLSLFYFHATGSFIKGPTVVMFLLALLFASNGVLFNNGMEFYVLLVVFLGLVMFDNKKTILFILIFNSILFLVAHKAAAHYAIQPAIENRNFINMAVWLLILLVCLYSFKSQNLMYMREMEAVNNELQESNRSKEKLFSIVAHDMRSPLNSLTSTLDLLDNQFIDEKAFRELSGLLANQTKHLSENMEVLLKWANSQLRGIEVHPKDIDLCVYIRDIVNLLSPLMKFKQIHCEQGCTEPVMVYADPDHIQLVLRNLLNNAIKFSYPGGTIYIHVERNANGMVWVNVRDMGVGMSTGTISNLFSGAVVQSSNGTRNEKGIGLGLQLSREFIQKNGGNILVQSELKKGSTFSFSIPAAAAV